MRMTAQWVEQLNVPVQFLSIAEYARYSSGPDSLTSLIADSTIQRQSG